MNFAGRVACCARPCGHTTTRARMRLRGDVEWICDDHWAMIPKAYRRAYLTALGRGDRQMQGALWDWARCRQAAINAEASRRWPIVQPETLCEDGSRPAPTGAGREPT